MLQSTCFFGVPLGSAELNVHPSTSMVGTLVAILGESERVQVAYNSWQLTCPAVQEGIRTMSSSLSKCYLVGGTDLWCWCSVCSVQVGMRIVKHYILTRGGVACFLAAVFCAFFCDPPVNPNRQQCQDSFLAFACWAWAKPLGILSGKYAFRFQHR